MHERGFEPQHAITEPRQRPIPTRIGRANRTFTYDTYGRMATSTDSEGYTLPYDYNALDRVRTIMYPDATCEEHEDDDHSLIATRDREGRWTRHSYSPLRERVVTDGGAGRLRKHDVFIVGQSSRPATVNTERTSAFPLCPQLPRDFGSGHTRQR
jgi:YD repeat-containing protein